MSQPVKKDALEYLALIKTKVDLHTYTLYVDILKKYHDYTIDVPTVIQQISQVLRGHDELLLGLNTFLPEEHRINTQDIKRLNQYEDEKRMHETLLRKFRLQKILLMMELNYHLLMELKYKDILNEKFVSLFDCCEIDEFDCLCGLIVEFSEEGYVYYGKIKNDEPHRKGIKLTIYGEVYLTDANNRPIESDFFYGDAEVYGEKMRIVDNSEVYLGHMKNGLRHGAGIELLLLDDTVYKGNWKDNEKHGHGVMTFLYGDTYDGEWNNSNFHGKGTYTWINGDTYDGEWKDDLRNGYGKLMYNNGNIYEGEWNDNKKHGRGVFSYNDGDTFKGRFNMNLMYMGTWTSSNGDIWEGTWNKKNRKHGVFIITYNDGTVATVKYVNNRPTGILTYETEDGMVVINCTYDKENKKSVYALADSTEEDAFHIYCEFREKVDPFKICVKDQESELYFIVDRYTNVKDVINNYKKNKKVDGKWILGCKKSLMINSKKIHIVDYVTMDDVIDGVVLYIDTDPHRLLTTLQLLDTLKNRNPQTVKAPTKSVEKNAEEKNAEEKNVEEKREQDKQKRAAARALLQPTNVKTYTGKAPAIKTSGFTPQQEKKINQTMCKYTKPTTLKTPKGQRATRRVINKVMKKKTQPRNGTKGVATKRSKRTKPKAATRAGYVLTNANIEASKVQACSGFVLKHILRPLGTKTIRSNTEVFEWNVHDTRINKPEFYQYLLHTKEREILICCGAKRIKNWLMEIHRESAAHALFLSEVKKSNRELIVKEVQFEDKKLEDGYMFVEFKNLHKP